MRETEQKEEIDRSFEATRFPTKIEETIYIYIYYIIVSYYNIGYGRWMDGPWMDEGRRGR